MIPRGGTFRIRNLSTGNTRVLKLEEKSVKQLHTVDDLSSISKNGYGMGHGTFPGFDAITCNPPILFNVTSATTTTNQLQQPRLSISSLKAAFSKLPEAFPKTFAYYWVVPSNTFEHFARQSVGGKGDQEVDQFAMELSISEQPVQNSQSTSAKRKQGDEEQEEHAGEVGKKDKVCKSLLKTGHRKGKKCGRMNCHFHSREGTPPTKKRK